MTMPSLFSQFVPSISSTSSDDLSRLASDGAGSVAAKLGEGSGVTGVEAGGIACSVLEGSPVVAGSAVFPVTQFSANRTAGLGSAAGSAAGSMAGGTGGAATMLGEKNVGACEVATATGLSVVLRVASSAVGLER